MAQEKGAQVARAYVLIVPSLQGAQKSITEELVPGVEAAGTEAGEKGGAKMREGLAKAAKLAAAATAAAMAGAVALIRQSLDAYANTEQLAGGVQKLFGDEAAAKVIANAADAYRTAGLSANDYLQSVTGISAALLKSGVSAEEAARLADQAMRDMADNANTFGTKTTEELGQVYAALARQSYAVLDQLNLGYGGTKTGMAQLVRDANEYAKATGRAADLTVDNFADIVTAISLIQEKIGIAETTVKEAEGTISGSLAMLRGAWTNLVAGFGDPAADLETLVDRVMESLEAVTRNIMPTVSRIAAGLTKALPDLVRQVAAFLPEVFPAILEAVAGIAQAIAEELPGMIDTILRVVLDNTQMLIDTAIEVALALVNAVPQIISALAPAIPKIVEGVTTGLLDNLPAFIAAAIDIVTGLVEAIPDIIKGMVDAIPRIVETLKNTFADKENQQKMIDAGQALGQALINGILSLVIPGLGNIENRIASATAAVPGYSGARLDLGGYDWLSAQGGGSISINNMSINADSSSTAASVFRQIRQAAAI